MTLVSLLNATIFKITGHTDICIGTPIGGREHDQLKDQVGLYANTVCLRTIVEAGFSFIDLLQVLKKTCLEAYEYQLYPYDQLVQDINLKSTPYKKNLFQILVVLQKKGLNFNNIRGLGEASLSSFTTEHTISRLPVTFNFVEEEALSCEIEYSTELFEEESIRLLYEKFYIMIAAVIEDPSRPLGQYDITLDIEKQLSEENIDIDIDF